MPPSTQQKHIKNEKPYDIAKNISKHDVELVEEYEETPLWLHVWTLMGYALITMFGHLNELLFAVGLKSSNKAREHPRMKVIFSIF